MTRAGVRPAAALVITLLLPEMLRYWDNLYTT